MLTRRWFLFNASRLVCRHLPVVHCHYTNTSSSRPMPLPRSFSNNIADNERDNKKKAIFPEEFQQELVDEQVDDEELEELDEDLQLEEEEEENERVNRNMEHDERVGKKEIRMPDMGNSHAGTILKWHKKEGDIIRYGDDLCDVKTIDFAFLMTSEDEHEKRMGKIMFQEGEKVVDGAVICETWPCPDNE